MKTLAEARLWVGPLELLQISIFMASTNECVIYIDAFSMYIRASLCPQSLLGIAAVRAILVRHVENHKPV